MNLLDGTHMQDLEPEIHNVIKKYLGFSEPKLLAATISTIGQGGAMEDISAKLSTLIDPRKAAKLACRIWDVVDDFCISRELSTIKPRKRPADGVGVYPGFVAKKSKDEPVVVGGVGVGVAVAPIVQPPPMTADQIRAMMANTLKQINERKKAVITGSAANGSLPIPQVNHLDQNAEEKAQTIAALQAQIASKMEKLADDVVKIPTRPQTLILDDKGRMIDTSGQEIQMTHHVPTLKANLRAKKRDELKDQHGASTKKEEKKEDSGDADDLKYYDPRLSKKTVVRGKRAFRFHEPGKFQEEGNRIRMKAQLERLQAGISTIARKTGITSATQLAKLVPKGDGKDRVPDVEWWDDLIITGSTYENFQIREEAITNLIEHPIQLQPLEPNTVTHVAVFLTKKERKKLRRQNRREAWKEKQDKIRLGILEPDQAKVKMSNLMRVLGTEAVQDPTKVEAHVREQMAKRLATHEKMNSERKLTPEQKKEKLARKLKEDTSGGIYVSVYRIKSLQNQSKRFKVETNAKQLYMTGCVVLYEDVNIVVMEGGPKQQKKYKQLMLQRIKWDEETYKDKDGTECVNKCVLVWEGQAKERSFPDIKIKMCPTESFAREFFKKAGVEHYWDQAYSEAVLEASENL